MFCAEWETKVASTRDGSECYREDEVNPNSEESAVTALQKVDSGHVTGDAIEVPRAAAMPFVSIFTPLERFVTRSWHPLSKNSVRTSGGANDNYQRTPCSSAPPLFKTAVAFEFDTHTVKYSQKVTDSGSFFSEQHQVRSFSCKIWCKRQVNWYNWCTM